MSDRGNWGDDADARGGRLLVFGSSGRAAEIIDLLQKHGTYRIVGLLDSFKAPGARVRDFEVLGSENDLPELLRRNEVAGIVIAVGDNWGRAQVARKIQSILPSLAFPVIVHPSADIGRGVWLSRGTVVMAGAMVGPEAQIGDFCFVHAAAFVGHDGRLAEFSSLAPRAALGGNVTVGAYSAVGIGACVVEKVTIGSHTVVGAGSVVAKDLPDNVVAYGNPARVIRAREPGEPYLR
jgi:sugar O-acyltransferase (sialic acid O-acetyltransferase NeuD family)